MPVDCWVVVNPTYQPAMRIVTAVTQSNPAVVTTSCPHQYENGIIVRFDIPLQNGMPQLAGTSFPWNTYVVTVVNATQFSVNVDSTNFQPYVDNVCCCVVPVGEQNYTIKQATRNVLPYQATI